MEEVEQAEQAKVDWNNCKLELLAMIGVLDNESGLLNNNFQRKVLVQSIISLAPCE